MAFVVVLIAAHVTEPNAHHAEKAIFIIEATALFALHAVLAVQMENALD
jgi:hypothetical protein